MTLSDWPLRYALAKRPPNGEPSLMSTNRFRPEHRSLTEVEKTLVSDIKDKAEELARLMDRVGGRHGALAQTHLETAVMFAVKGVTA